MPAVWVVFPSARPEAEVNSILKLWRDQGYMTAVWRDCEPILTIDATCLQIGAYEGYAATINKLCATVLEKTDAQWIVCAADDIEPDPIKAAHEIAAECSLFFSHQANYATFGVMQPTGDRWGADEAWAKRMFPDAPAYIDRICGSAWIGREFIQNTYSGRGPFHPGYRHMYCDEELQEVAKKLGVLWQRPDLTHYHRHWARRPDTSMDECPDFLKDANSPEAWKDAKSLFEQRKAQGWPGAIWVRI